MNLLRFAPLRHTAALLLGLSLLGTAQAAPVLQDSTRFQVQIDSRSLSGEGWLAFTLLPGALPASGVQVMVSQFSGQWLTDQVREGDVQSSAEDEAPCCVWATPPVTTKSCMRCSGAAGWASS